MNKLITLIIALYLIGSAIVSLVTGETIGFAAGYSATRSITFDSNPVEFVIMIFAQFGIAVLILKEREK